VARITAGSVQDRDGAVPVLQEAHEMVKRSDDMKGFVVVPRRWCVERTFGWFGKYRLLNKEYERTLESSKADIHYAMTSLMLRRLTTPGGVPHDA
ncbi:MAG TPA: transposase, partial [Polyangium sp.]|nr:transposase [Polyangium sp.]